MLHTCPTWITARCGLNSGGSRLIRPISPLRISSRAVGGSRSKPGSPVDRCSKMAQISSRRPPIHAPVKLFTTMPKSSVASRRCNRWIAGILERPQGRGVEVSDKSTPFIVVVITLTGRVDPRHATNARYDHLVTACLRQLNIEARLQSCARSLASNRHPRRALHHIRLGTLRGKNLLRSTRHNGRLGRISQWLDMLRLGLVRLMFAYVHGMLLC